MRNEEHALFTYMYMYYINKSNGHSRQKVVMHIIRSPRAIVTENYTITGKGFDFVFVWYWDTTTYGKLKQWRQPANETKIMCTKKKNIKPKVSHTSFFISTDQNQTIQIFNYTIQRKCKLIEKGRKLWTHIERGSLLLTSDRLFVLCFSL